MISIIAAMTQDRVIGNGNGLPWYIPKDLKRVKEITYGKKLIMGRKTFDTFKKPLPNREHLVISRTETNSNHTLVKFYNSYDFVEEYIESDEEVFLFGGGQIYKDLMKYAKKMYLTIVLKEFEGSVHFPEIDYSKWNLVEEINESDREIDFIYKTYVLKS